jgi:DNA repair protein RadC
MGIEQRKRIVSPEDVAKMFRKYSMKRQEYFLVATIIGERVVGTHVATIGIANRAIVHSREVFWWAIKDSATRVVVAHNHPSGRLEPSPEDDDITSNLFAAGKIVGITLLDHLIIYGDGYFSYRKAGRILTPDPGAAARAE